MMIATTRMKKRRLGSITMEECQGYERPLIHFPLPRPNSLRSAQVKSKKDGYRILPVVDLAILPRPVLITLRLLTAHMSHFFFFLSLLSLQC